MCHPWSWVGKNEKCTGMTSDGMCHPVYLELTKKGSEIVKGQEVHWDDQLHFQTIENIGGRPKSLIFLKSASRDSIKSHRIQGRSHRIHHRHHRLVIPDDGSVESATSYHHLVIPDNGTQNTHFWTHSFPCLLSGWARINIQILVEHAVRYYTQSYWSG